MVKIGVSNLKARPGSELDFCLKENWSYLKTSEAKLPIIAPVVVQGRVTNNKGIFTVTAKVATTLELICDRCLSKYNLKVSVPLEELYAEGSVIKSLPEENEKEDQEIRLLEKYQIDLGPAVNQALIMALPMKFLCKEDCLGLCSQCGQNLNKGQCQCESDSIDLRFEVLKQWLNNKEGEK
ncbi:MAG: hypothetical protein PWP31_1030 [Clostridia bacterium]|nr:hypothetical protein [Clostridia bacterium]